MRVLGAILGQEPFPTISTHDIGTGVMVLIVMVLMLDRLKSLFWPDKPLAEEFVRRAELDRVQVSLSTFVQRVEMQRMEQKHDELSKSMQQKHDELSHIMQQKHDDLNRSINDIRVNVEAVRREVHVEINNAVERVVARLLENFHLRPRYPDSKEG